jgi:hypothetical protein
MTQLREEYEAVLKEGRVGGLPSYETLTKPFLLDPASTGGQAGA